MAFESGLPGQLKELNSKLPADRISSLPDEILINILNFLPTKYAFITSILSRRWSHLFKEVNSIDFDDSLQFNDLIAFDHEKRWVAFEAFVCKMIDYIKLSNLTRFRFIYADYRCMHFVTKVQSWLPAVLSHGIQEIDLCFNAGIYLPDTIFTCKTLCILKLSVYGTTYLPDTVCLPCLKIFHLKRVMILEMASVSKFLSGCPLLHDFCLESYSLTKAGELSISSPSLTRLRLESWMRFNNFQCRPLVAVVAPLLQYFHYADHLANSYSITTSSYLVEAYLDIPDNRDYENASVMSHSARDLIQGVSSVKHLFLSTHCMEALTSVKDELPILRNLIKLKLGCSIMLHATLPSLLESAPYLEELVFTEGLLPMNFTEKDIVRQDYWGRHEEVPSCLKTQLKVIEIEHFQGFGEELRMVEYFLSNGHSLTQVTIHKFVGIKKRFKVTKQLKRMATRWKKCVHFGDRLL